MQNFQEFLEPERFQLFLKVLRAPRTSAPPRSEATSAPEWPSLRGARCEVRGASLYSMSASRGALRWSLLPSKGDPPQFATTCCHHTMDRAALAAPAAPPEPPAPHPVKRRIKKK